MLLGSRYVTLAAAVVVCIAVVPPACVAMTLPPLCDGGSHYAPNGTFHANLDLLSSWLPTNTSASAAGFATASVGAAPDEANALALCRGDIIINASACAACVAEAFRDARRVCPLDRGFAVYRDACVLRFASSRFVDFLRPDQWLVSELNPVVDVALGNVNAPDAWFSAAVAGILTALVDRAAVASNSTRKYFATGDMDFDPKIYGLAQCTPDLTPGQCRGCLELLSVTTTNRLQSRRPTAHNAFVVWCQLRYSVSSQFYEGQATLQLPAPPEPPTQATLGPPTSESGAGRTLKFLFNDDRGTKEIAVLATAIAVALL